MKSFPNSFINQHGEFIAHSKGNAYFGISNCNTDLEIKCKVLEWFSREAYKAQPFRNKKKNEEFNSFMLGGINKFLSTDFNANDIKKIYSELGNQANREATKAFILGEYNMSLLD